MKLHFLERQEWLFDRGADELRILRHRWLRADREDHAEIALLRWRYPVAGDEESARELLEPWLSHERLGALANERLAEVEQRTSPAIGLFNRVGDTTSAELDLRQVLEDLLAQMEPRLTVEQRERLISSFYWLATESEAELAATFRAWLNSDRDDLIDVALLPWPCFEAGNSPEVRELLVSLLDNDQFHERAQQRLDDFDERQR